MQRQLFLLLLLCCGHCLFAQRESLTYYNNKDEETAEKKAAWLLQKRKLVDTCYEWNYYKKDGPRMKSVRFKNAAGTVMHGQFINYDATGLADSMGFYKNGVKDGEWIVYATNTRPLYKIVYEGGTLISQKDSFQMKTVPNADAEKARNENNIETESDFQGGQAGWLQHLQKNLRYPAEAIDKGLQGKVIIQFIVSKNGEVEDPGVFRSVNMYIDKEALRMITISPRWEPAVQHGTRVKSYKRQPIIFRLGR